MRERLVLYLAHKLVLGIGTRLAPLHHFLPRRCVCGRLARLLLGPVNGSDLDALRVIAAEMRRVHDDLVHEAGRAQADNHPVHVALFARPLRLPAVAHVLAAPRQDEVVLGAKVLVAARHGHAAVLRRGQVQDGVGVRGQDGHGVAKEPEAGDAAVWVHVEADVRVARAARRVGGGGGGGEFPGKALRRPAWLDAQDRLPGAAAALPGQHAGVGVGIGLETALDRDKGRVVAAEKGRVDLDAFDGARGHAEPDDDPVKRLWVVAARLPAVVPGACVDHLAGLADGSRRREQVACFGEPFVGEAEDFATQGGGDEVCFFFFFW